MLGLWPESLIPYHSRKYRGWVKQAKACVEEAHHSYQGLLEKPLETHLWPCCRNSSVVHIDPQDWSSISTRSSCSRSGREHTDLCFLTGETIMIFFLVALLTPINGLLGNDCLFFYIRIVQIFFWWHCSIHIYP